MGSAGSQSRDYDLNTSNDETPLRLSNELKAGVQYQGYRL